MRSRAHTNTSTRRAHKKLRVAVSACLAAVFVCVIGGFALLHTPASSQDPLKLPETQPVAISDDGQQSSDRADACLLYTSRCV